MNITEKLRKLYGQEVKETSGGIIVSLNYFLDVCKTLHHEYGAVLSTMTGIDFRQVNGNYRLDYVFSLDDEKRFFTVSLDLPGEKPEYLSLTPYIYAAHWYEREAMDMLGILPLSHPEPNRLVLHHQWPPGTRPLKKDFHLPQNVGEGQHRFSEVKGEGSFYVPVGPIHAGIIEPGHFRFGTAGEFVINLEARLFYTHRGVEKIIEGKSLDEGLGLAERICGVCSYTHSTSYCQAAEELTNTEIPQRARFIRTFLLEMERLYNHIGDVGNICAGVGMAFGTSQCGRLKEELQRLNKNLTGHRFLRGINTVGGLKNDISTEKLKLCVNKVKEISQEFNKVTEILLTHDSLLNRLKTTGKLSLKTIQDLGVVGPAARASGWRRDARKIHPHAAYDQIDFDVVTVEDGDVYGRMVVRIQEVAQSVKILEQITNLIKEGKVYQEPGIPQAWEFALGCTESPRGENIHYLMLDDQGKIYRYRVRSASFTNWPAVALAVTGNIVPDFPLINKSFELCYACLDR